jgi:RsiW-degrading membrane proteinase PrsW (M82 family)
MKKIYGFLDSLATVFLSNILLVIFIILCPGLLWFSVDIPKWILIILILFGLLLWILLYMCYLEILRKRKNKIINSSETKNFLVGLSLLISILFILVYGISILLS